MSRILVAAAVAIMATAASITPAVSAAATTTPVLTAGASAYSAGAANGTANLKANLQLTGSLGGILDSLIGPIVSQDLNPLVGALQASVNELVATALGSASGYNASTTPSQNQMSTAPAAFPNDTLPSPCLSSGSQPCYSASSSSAINAAPLVTAGLGLVNGYVEQVMSSADATNAVFARAAATNPQVSVLPGITSLVPGLPNVANPLVSATAVAAKANCPNDGAVGATKPATAPSAAETVASVTLLGGLVTLGVLDGQIINLKVNGVAFASILALPTVTVSGVTISPFGNSIMVSIPLSVAQLLVGLGLPGQVASALTGFAASSTVQLRIVVGPNSTVTSRTVSAWGLGIGVDLSGALSFNLLNLVGASVNIPTGIGGGNYGNLLDLRLAYVTCRSGTNTPPIVPAVPPALV